MKNRVVFQTQLASIMEALAKAAVAEISKLVENDSVVLRLEVSRSHEEIDCLRRKLLRVESELRTAQEAATRESRSVGVQVEDHFEAARGAVQGGADAPFKEPVNKKKCKRQTHNTSHKEINRLRSKLQQVESDLRTAQEARTGESRSVGVQVADQFEAAGGAVEQLIEQNCEAQACDSRPEFGYTVKEEQEEERVAQILHQTESEDSAGRLNNVGPELQNKTHRASQFSHQNNILIPAW
ncbi:hypothetical protein GJAV_G00093730 [Gymnothorax javanicus]|nr:hypothetical protein GJAV_G00093730 [Gymnothorax javanicus]